MILYENFQFIQDLAPSRNASKNPECRNASSQVVIHVARENNASTLVLMPIQSQHKKNSDKKLTFLTSVLFSSSVLILRFDIQAVQLDMVILLQRFHISKNGVFIGVLIRRHCWLHEILSKQKVPSRFCRFDRHTRNAWDKFFLVHPECC